MGEQAISPEEGLQMEEQAAQKLFSLSEQLTPKKSKEKWEDMLPQRQNIDILDRFSARHAGKYLMEKIQAFESALDDEHEIAIQLLSFGQSLAFTITDISYTDPNILVFDGYVAGQPITLLQSISQFNVLLTSVPKRDPEKRKSPIGFHFPTEDSADQ